MATTAEAENRPAGGAIRLPSSAAALFAPGAEVEVRSRFTQLAAVVSSGSGAEKRKREVVIYARATVVSASAGTASYLVRYPAAAGLLPSRVARVPASDVRAPRRRPATAVDAAPARTTSGRGIPMDALQRFFEEHERVESEAAKKKKKKVREQDEDELALQKQDASVFFLSLLSS